MDGRRSFPEEQEPRWYSGQREYAEPDWRTADEDRHRSEEFRAVEQASGTTGERRYGELSDTGSRRYGEPGPYGAGDPLRDDRFDTDGYRSPRSRHADQESSFDDTDGDRSGGPVRKARRAARDERAAPLVTPDPLSSADPFRTPDPLSSADLLRTPDPHSSADLLRTADPLSSADSLRGYDPVRDLDPAGGMDPVRPVESALPSESRDDVRDAIGAGRSAADQGRSGRQSRAPGDSLAESAGPTGFGADVREAGPDPTRSAPLGGYPIVDRGRGPEGARPVEPLELPTGPMPAILPRPDPISGAGLPPYAMAGGPEVARRPGLPAGDGVYRTRRPVLAVIFALFVLIFEIPALLVLISAALADPVSAGGVVAGTFLVGGLPIFAVGLYGLRTGGVALSEPGRIWLRPPTAYLTVGLVLFVAAALAAG